MDGECLSVSGYQRLSVVTPSHITTHTPSHTACISSKPTQCHPHNPPHTYIHTQHAHLHTHPHPHMHILTPPPPPLTHTHTHSMHILPQPHSEGSQFYRHATGIDSHIEYSMVDTPNPDDVSHVIPPLMSHDLYFIIL